MLRRFVPNIKRAAAAGIALLLLAVPAGFADTNVDPVLLENVRGIVDRECTHLNKERMNELLNAQFGTLPESAFSSDFLRIVEGVVKRTDFDGIPEEKTAEIVGLVNAANRKGAPLDQLDEIFDVAYVNTISVDQLVAAANALKEFSSSDVPQEIFEEFVYHSIEEGWDPAVMPMLTRGLIYGVDRGLSPDKIALIIMLDVHNGELKNKKPEQLVMDAIKLVRDKEPGKWKPMSQVEREMAEKLDKKRMLERTKDDLDEQLQKKERAVMAAATELKELREYPDKQMEIDREKLERDLEELIRKLQGEITQVQNKQRNVVAELETTRKDVERRQEVKDRQRKQKREQELAKKHQAIKTKAKQGRVNKNVLTASVDKWFGTPYRFGGDSERGIDCSAFTRRVYRDQGVELPRNSREQARISSAVAYNGVSSGDLIFFDTSISGTISHVGVYLGNNTFAHASSSKGVTRSSLKEKYYVKRFVKGGRIFQD